MNITTTTKQYTICCIGCSRTLIVDILYRQLNEKWNWIRRTLCKPVQKENVRLEEQRLNDTDVIFEIKKALAKDINLPRSPNGYMFRFLCSKKICNYYLLLILLPIHVVNFQILQISQKLVCLFSYIEIRSLSFKLRLRFKKKGNHRTVELRLILLSLS